MQSAGKDLGRLRIHIMQDFEEKLARIRAIKISNKKNIMAQHLDEKT